MSVKILKSNRNFTFHMEMGKLGHSKYPNIWIRITSKVDRSMRVLLAFWIKVS